MRFQSFDPALCRFPRPYLPMTPPLSLRDWGGGEHSVTSAFQHGDVRHFRLGRYALAAAMRQAGAGPGSAVLMPSYHCRTMIDPVLSLGAETLLYPLHADLSPRMEGLDQIRQTSPVPIRALVLTHYFGWPQPAASIRAWCDRHGVALIEDCSHRPWGWRNELLPGESGDYATTSPHKLAPGAPGGLLISRSASRRAGQANSLGEEGRALLRNVRLALATRPKPPTPAQQAILLARLSDVGAVCGKDELHDAPPVPSPMYRLQDEDRRGFFWSRWTFRHAAADAIAQRRRQRYMEWLSGLRGIPHCQPLFPDLPDTVVPAFFPLLIDHPAPHFFQLKHLAMPIWRWDELAENPCPVAQDYRLRLLHLPCHQGLGEADMAWMLNTLGAVLAHPARRHAV